MARGSKKTVEALEQKFETSKKPIQQDFFDLLASFYHKDEDLAFLISISKATLTDVQAGEDHTRFMTSLRAVQAIRFWTRLSKLEDLQFDVNTLVMTRINEMWDRLLATNDNDSQINTLGEIFLVLQNFNEWTGGIKSLFDHLNSVLRDVNGDREVRNTFDNHSGRLENIEFRLIGVPNNERQVQNSFDSLFSVLRDINGERVVRNTFDNHSGRLGNIEYLLKDLSGERVVKNGLDTLFSVLKDLSGERAVKNELDSHDGRITTAQNRANEGVANAATAQSRANEGVANAATAQSRANEAYDKGVEAKSRADDAHNAIGRPDGSNESVWSRITGVYSYSVVVAGVVNQIESMLGGYSFGQANVIKSAADNTYNRTSDLYLLYNQLLMRLNGLDLDVASKGNLINDLYSKTNSIESRLHDAGIGGF